MKGAWLFSAIACPGVVAAIFIYISNQNIDACRQQMTHMSKQISLYIYTRDSDD